MLFAAPGFSAVLCSLLYGILCGASVLYKTLYSIFFSIHQHFFSMHYFGICTVFIYPPLLSVIMHSRFATLHSLAFRVMGLLHCISYLLGSIAFHIHPADSHSNIWIPTHCIIMGCMAGQYYAIHFVVLKSDPLSYCAFNALFSWR